MTEIGSIQFGRVLPIRGRQDVPPTPPCPPPTLHEHRMCGYPKVVDLLGVLPGSVPYSTYLEIETALARLRHEAVLKGLEGLGSSPEEPERQSLEPGEGELAAREGPRPIVMPETEPAAERSVRREVVTQEYVVRRRRWPVGGLIDLVI